jgi:hypothetical protein
MRVLKLTLQSAPGTQELFGRLVQAWIDTGAEKFLRIAARR